MGRKDGECCEGKNKDLELNMLLHREPVELLKNTGAMIKYRGFGDDAGCRFLNHLEPMEGLFRGTKKTVTIVIL